LLLQLQGRLRVRRIHLRIKWNLDAGRLVAVFHNNVDLFKVLEQSMQVDEMGPTAGVVATQLALPIEYVPRIQYGRVLGGFNRAAPVSL
jgi:hypothetical protein